jgi:hypothetical protein
MIEVILSAAAIIVTVVGAAMGLAKSYGSNIQALTQLTDQVRELRDTQAKTLARVGRLEAFAEIMPELSGRVRNIE